jgi:hypothetical protein
MQDCIIVGGGPAGLTAALYLARYLRRVTVVDAREGRCAMIPKTHNFAPFPDGIEGTTLLARMRAHAQLYGAVLHTGRVSAVTRHGEGFQVTMDGRPTETRTVILATGVHNHRPPLPTAQHDVGLARGLIRYCPVCDGYEVRGRRVAVLGSGAHGLKEARFVLTYSASVMLIPTDGTVASAAGGGRRPAPRDGKSGLVGHRGSGDADQWSRQRVRHGLRRLGHNGAGRLSDGPPSAAWRRRPDLDGRQATHKPGRGLCDWRRDRGSGSDLGGDGSWCGGGDGHSQRAARTGLNGKKSRKPVGKPACGWLLSGDRQNRRRCGHRRGDVHP